MRRVALPFVLLRILSHFIQIEYLLLHKLLADRKPFSLALTRALYTRGA